MSTTLTTDDDYDDTADWFLTEEEPETNPFQVVETRGRFWVIGPDVQDGPFSRREDALEHAECVWWVSRP